MKPVHVMALMGATGTGKSALAMRLAADFPIRIIACDSMQMYRGLDIGTAKPSLQEQDLVPHSMIDVLDLPMQGSAALWAKGAAQAIQQAVAEQRMPLVVGGTGLYWRALAEGLADIPELEASIKQDLQARYQDQGLAALYAQLQVLDAATAARLKATDGQRILRALGVCLTTGRPFSWYAGQRQKPLDFSSSVYVLDVERDRLRARLAQRFQQMLDAGWLDELAFLQAHDLPSTHPVMRAVAYRQLLSYVQGNCSLSQACADGLTATRRYAKRQRTWFKHQIKQAYQADAKRVLAAMQRELSA